ncbi:MAG: hypothetical protein ACREEM_08060 [Blastocatellia bacterium]
MQIHRVLLLTLMLISSSLVMLSEAFGQNLLLRELVKEDQDSRTGKKVTRTDPERIKIVLAQIAQGALTVPEDKFNAALVLQHTGLKYCEKRLVGISPDNYLLAHHLALSAFEAGYKDARQLVAATIDRYLYFTEGYQKYGTQQIFNQETEKDEWAPIDRKTSDSERAKYGVPPLDKLLKQFPEQAPIKKQ